MSTLSEIIKNEPKLIELGQDYKAIADWLNFRAIVQNPVPQEDVFDQIESIDQIFAIVMDGDTIEQDQQAILAIAALIDAGRIIGDYVGIPAKGDAARLTGLMEISGMSSITAGRIRERLVLTEPDPNYQAQILGPSRAELLGHTERINAETIQEALN